MRIHIILRSENRIIPFNHQHLLTGCIHKWLGENNEHGALSLYSFSRLIKGKRFKDGLIFDNDSSFFFSAFDNNLVKQIINGIQKSPEMFYGLSVKEIVMQEDPDLSKKELFQIGSPVFIKRRNSDNHIEHIAFNDAKANEYLSETLLRKMQQAGLKDDSLDISFDTSYAKADTKLITYKNIKNRANWCPIIIKGKPETKAFAWNVGLGNSTGIGFGAIK